MVPASHRIRLHRLIFTTIALITCVVIVFSRHSDDRYSPWLSYEPKQPTIALDSVYNGKWGSFPLKPEDFDGYTSPFGWRTHPISGDQSFHSGMDIAADEGKPVYPWWSGTVSKVTFQEGGCGLYVAIVSGKWEHLYCHLSEAKVKEGQQVTPKDVVGLIGHTGSATGPHLHWQVYFGDDLINPARIIRAMKAAIIFIPKCFGMFTNVLFSNKT